MASKQFTAVSYEDRLRNEAHRMCIKKLEKLPCFLPVETQQTDGERVIYKTEYREVDLHALDKYKVTDFCLENLIAVGSTELNPMSLMRDPLSANDNIVNQMSNLKPKES